MPLPADIANKTDTEVRKVVPRWDSGFSYRSPLNATAEMKCEDRAKENEERESRVCMCWYHVCRGYILLMLIFCRRRGFSRRQYFLSLLLIIVLCKYHDY